MLHLWVDEGKPRECRLIHGVYEVLLAVGEARLLAEELPVKVAAVVWRFLELKSSRMNEKQLQTRVSVFPERRTTLGLKGGSTSLLSKAGQSIILKKGCKRMSPTTPSL